MSTVIKKNKPARRGRPPAFDRAQVLDRAIGTFWELGYEGASINELTAAMGITAQSLYAAFGSKSALYHEALTRYQQTIGRFATQALEQEGSALAAFARMLRESASEFSNPQRPRGCMIATATLTCSSANQHEVRYLSKLRNASVEAFKRRIDTAIESGEFAPDTDSTALASYLGAIVQGMSVQAQDGASESQLAALAELAIQTLRQARARQAEQGEEEAD